MNPYTSSSSPTQPHDRFYLLDDFVVLEVGSTVFRLPAFILKNHSSKLRDLIEANQGNNGKRIELKSISAIDFERLLLVIFPRKFGEYEISLPEEWTSVLKTANVLGCPSIQKLAVAQLDSVASAIDRIVLGRQYNFPKLVASGYVELCQREAPITLLEGHSLGMGDIIDISSIRHHLRCSGKDTDITKASVLEICSEPGRQVLEHNSVADFVAATFSDTGNPSVPPPGPYVPPLSSLQNFIQDASFGPAAGSSGWVDTSAYSASGTGLRVLPQPSTSAPPSAQKPKKPKKPKNEVRSNKGLAKSVWQVKYGKTDGFKPWWKATTPQYKQLWVAEWENHAKDMDKAQLAAFSRRKRIQDMIQVKEADTASESSENSLVW